MLDFYLPLLPSAATIFSTFLSISFIAGFLWDDLLLLPRRIKGLLSHRYYIRTRLTRCSITKAGEQVHFTFFLTLISFVPLSFLSSRLFFELRHFSSTRTEALLWELLAFIILWCGYRLPRQSLIIVYSSASLYFSDFPWHITYGYKECTDTFHCRAPEKVWLSPMMDLPGPMIFQSGAFSLDWFIHCHIYSRKFLFQYWSRNYFVVNELPSPLSSLTNSSISPFFA